MPSAPLSLFAITFVDVLGFTILIPILPFCAERFDASASSLLCSPFRCRLNAGTI
jgi:hypothetical protein